MRKALLLFTVLFIFCLHIQAQNKNSINGSIVDSVSKQPVDYATITLSNAKTNKVLTGGTTDSLGYFTINDLDSGLYNILVESINYRPKTIKNFRIKESHIPQSTGTIQLFKTSNALKDVVVTTTQQKLIENKIDKLVYNAENDITSQGGVATDILKKVPQVSVDADGNVELAGSSDIRFLINGKPSTAFGSNIADVLQAIPASEIKSVEVITNPGARYDAQGLGGIINIILKKSNVNGVNGNISLTAGTRLENGSFNITLKKNNFSLNAFGSGLKRLTSATPTSVYRTSIDTIAKQNGILKQNGEPESNRSGLEGGLGFDWSIDTLNSLSGSVDYNRFEFAIDGSTSQEQQTIPFNPDSLESDIFSLNKLTNHYAFSSTDASVTYQKKFKREDQLLEVDLNTSFGNNNSKSGNEQFLSPQNLLYYGINNNNHSKQNESEIEIDYTQPFNKKVTLDAGTDFTFGDLKSNSNVYSVDTASDKYFYDSSISNYLSYKQNVYAAYAEISFPVGKLFDAKVGSRYERTELNTFFSEAQQQVKTPGYNTWVPSVFISKKLTENQTLKASYSKRINRPDYEDLNPFINTSDPKNVSTGNPYLKPETGYRLELSYTHDYGQKGSFIITAGYRQSNHDIQPYTVFYPSFVIADSTYYNVAVSTNENIGSEKNLGVNLFGTIKTTNKLYVRTNMLFFRRHIINSIDNGRNPVSFNYRMNINLTYQFDKSLSAEFFGNFNSPRNEIQGKYPSFTTYTFAARKQFHNKKASLALTINNFAGKYQSRTTVLYGTNFTTNNYRKIPSRSFGLNFTYKFGRLNFKDDKKDNENAPEDNNAGGGNK